MKRGKAAAASSSLRLDVHLPNESDGLVFTSQALRGRGLGDGAEWQSALTAGDLLGVGLECEDPVNVRVVVGGTLEAAERAEWLGRMTAGLRVRDGQLALCGGVGYVASGLDDWARLVAIPAGDYAATLYCYASAPLAHACLARAGADEPLGAWFRRTRKGKSMPAWLHNRCVNVPDEDPGHAMEWKRAKLKRDRPVIDLLLHLEPAASLPAPPESSADGFAEPADCRKPGPFPMGLPARDLVGGEDDSAGEAEAADDTAVPSGFADVRARARDLARTTLAGGPVEVPVAKLARAFRLAWMCHASACPEIRVEFAKGVRMPSVESLDVNDVLAESQGREMVVRWSINSLERPWTLREAARKLAALPGICRIELDTALLSPAAKATPGLALHRFAGTVAAGVWRIDEAFPEVPAARLAEALGVAAIVEGTRVVPLRDADEAAQVEARMNRHVFEAAGAPSLLTRNGAELTLARRDETLLAHIARRVFWLRFGDTWPLLDLDTTPDG